MKTLKKLFKKIRIAPRKSIIFIIFGGLVTTIVIRKKLKKIVIILFKLSKVIIIILSDLIRQLQLPINTPRNEFKPDNESAIRLYDLFKSI